MSKAQLLLKKHSPMILTVAGATGVVATAVLSVKATPKALQLLEYAQYEKGEKLTVKETIQTAWVPYVPAALTGFATIACIFGANMLNKRQQASLMSAYAILDKTYREYTKKVKELYEENADNNIKSEIVKSKFDKNMALDEEKELFFDFQSARWFESTFEEVKHAEHVFNQCFATTGFACLNDFYEILGMEPVDYGYQIGWSDLSENELEFEYEKVETDDGLEAWIMSMPNPPSLDYIC